MNQLKAKDYRDIAKNVCSPYSGTLAIIYLIYLAIFAAISSAFSRVGQYVISPATYDQYGNIVTQAVYGYSGSNITSILELILAGPFSLGLIHVTKDLFDDKKPAIEELFSGFTQFLKALFLQFLTSLFVFLWSLLLIVPGIMKAYSYSLAFYILDDDPDIPAMDALEESEKIMKGHRWELFCLDVSYIGWILLSLLTLGILYLFVLPKINAAHYAFYLHVTNKDEHLQNENENINDDYIDISQKEA